MVKYGVDHPMKNKHQASSIKHQASYKRKPYTFPSGRIEQVQGYESFCIGDLLF
jgi:hypothetical protein